MIVVNNYYNSMIIFIETFNFISRLFISSAELLFQLEL